MIVAAKNTEFTQADRNFASIHPRVYLWDDNFLKYYSKLAKKVGDYAMTDILGELDIRLDSHINEEDLDVPAIETKLRGRRAFLFYANPYTLLNLAYVARREKGREQHYQRLVDSKRLGNIGKFISDRRKKGFFANNIILNFTERVTFKAFSRPKAGRGLRFGTLHLPKEHRSAWIIDGQHRLFGFTRPSRTIRDLLLPTIAFDSLGQSQQAELFLEINRNQKAIRPDLIWDLEGEINPSTNYGVISWAVKNLNRMGPLQDTIRTPTASNSKSRHIGLGNLCDGILDRGLADRQTESMAARAKNPLYSPAYHKKREKIARALRAFFSTAEEVLARDWKKKRDGFFFTNNGINVLLRIFEATLAYYKHTPKRREARKILTTIRKRYQNLYPRPKDVESLLARTSSEGGRAAVAVEFLINVEKSLKLKGFCPKDVSLPSIQEDASALERKLARSVSSRLEVVAGPSWLKRRAPADIVKKVRERRTGKKLRIDQVLTLGECKMIITQEDNWRDAFVPVFKRLFRNKDTFRVKFDDITSIRNTAIHRPDDLTERDEALFRFLEKDILDSLSGAPKQQPIAERDRELEPSKRHEK